MKICVVDDSSVVRTVVKQALNMGGYTEIIEAEDGVEALKKIEPEKTDIGLYVLDVNMPNMDGLTLLGEIRAFDQTTPIIILTTETDKSKMITAKERGATGWIVKPFEADKFINVVDMFLKK